MGRHSASPVTPMMTSSPSPRPTSQPQPLLSLDLDPIPSSKENILAQANEWVFFYRKDGDPDTSILSYAPSHTERSLQKLKGSKKTFVLWPCHSHT